MKKVFVFMMTVMMMVTMVITMASGEEYMDNFSLINYVHFDRIEEEFSIAVEKGDHLSSVVALYDNCVYMAYENSCLYATGMGFDLEINRENMALLEKHIEKYLADNGVKNPEVKILYAGQYYSIPIYEVIIKGTGNFNELEIQKTNGIVYDGIYYDTMKVLCPIE